MTPELRGIIIRAADAAERTGHISAEERRAILSHLLAPAPTVLFDLVGRDTYRVGVSPREVRPKSRAGWRALYASIGAQRVGEPHLPVEAFFPGRSGPSAAVHAMRRAADEADRLAPELAHVFRRAGVAGGRIVVPDTRGVRFDCSLLRALRVCGDRRW